MYDANRYKIIPFPGVSLSEGDIFQNTLDGFLKETGYSEDREAPKVRGLPQSDTARNEIENFLRVMGYTE